MFSYFANKFIVSLKRKLHKAVLCEHSKPYVEETFKESQIKTSSKRVIDSDKKCAY